jgi:hypothetical protein
MLHVMVFRMTFQAMGKFLELMTFLKQQVIIAGKLEVPSRFGDCSSEALSKALSCRLLPAGLQNVQNTVRNSIS